MNKPLDTYRAKRNFSKTPEPAGRRPAKKGGNSYVIQKHAARRLHYDFRLELNGVLKSWAVPEGPSLVPGKKRLAVHVEDHPLEYGGFEGVIPRGEYGAGTVMVWDRGIWAPALDPESGYRKGHLKFELQGEKLKGAWHLVRMARKPREKQEAWLLFKSDDEAARGVDAADILEEMPRSAATGRDLEEIARDQDRIWSSKQGSELAKPIDPGRARRSKPVLDPSALPKAKAGPLLTFVEPCLPSAVDKAPSGADWVHEIKYDGYRVQARIEKGKSKLLTRQGLDWTKRFTRVAEAAARLPVKSALVDGEIVVQTEAGAASFTALVEALKSGKGDLVLHAFDLLHLDGFDLRDVPLAERKSALAKIIAANGPDACIRFSEHLAGDGDMIFRHAGRLGLEGIVSKKLSAPYRSGRVTNWVKVKSAQRGIFVVAAFMTSSVAKNAVGALVLGEYMNRKLVPSGHVGSGFSSADARELWQKLDPLRRQSAPLQDETAIAKGAKWVEPALAAEVEYRGRTAAGLIRHATFRALRQDIDPITAVRVELGPTKAPKEAPPLVRLTNPGRSLWPEQGITKQGLADFYVEIADWILPHIAGRPLSLVRCPGGVEEQCFFQKHRWAGLGDAVRSVAVPHDEPMLALDDLAGLLELAQASVLEIHPWGSKAEAPELPDRATIDLDPGEDVPWEQVVEAAFEVRDRLSGLGLQSFVKTTGGKGLHVVFPLAPKAGWDVLKSFTQSIAERMAVERPERYTANMAKKRRGGRVFVDYLRNAMGATAVGAYSTRARAGAAVSTPLSWDELGTSIHSNHFTVDNLPKRLSFLDSDPWEGFLRLRQELPGAGRATVATRTKRGTKTVDEPGLSSESTEQLPPEAALPSQEDLAKYWESVATDALEHLGRRPLRLFHRGSMAAVPETLHRLEIQGREGGKDGWLWIDSLQGLLGLVGMGVVEIHPCGASVDDIERPDTFVFGLEPRGAADWKGLTQAAFHLRDLLSAEGLECWPKLTGGLEVQVMVPVEPELRWIEAHRYSASIAEKLAAAAPSHYTTTAAPTGSHELYINFSYNRRGSTSVGAYSPRARPGFPIAAPVTWRELQRGLRPEGFTIFGAPARRRAPRRS